MSEQAPPTTPTEDPVEAPADRVPARKRRVVQRWTRRAFALLVAVTAMLLVSLFSLDLGSLNLGRFSVKSLAERGGSQYLRRPLHIGSISARLTPGVFIFHDVVIEGRAPADRPFFRVQRILLNVPWWTIFSRQLHVNVRLDDWAMLIESFPDGSHNIPHLVPDRKEPTAPRPFTTTVDFAYAHGGQFTYEDHATPWSVVAPNLTFDFARSVAFEQYVGRARFQGGTVQIQGYEPMAADLDARFELDGPMVHLRHIDLVADGSVSHVTGDIDMANWPNQYYNIQSTIDFARMKALFFTRETWRLRGEGAFTGRFMLGKGGVRDLSGSFSSDSAAVDDLEFRSLHGDLTWGPSLFAVTHAEAAVLGGRTRFRYTLAPLGTPAGSTVSFDADYADVDLFELDRLMNLRGLRLAGVATGSVSLQWPNGRMSSARRGIGHTVITPVGGEPLAPQELPSNPLPPAREPTPFDPNPLGRPLAVGADLHYRFEPGRTMFDESRVATTHSFISFTGRMASDGTAEFPFHVTSHDWQESDRLLVAIMSAVSGPTHAVEVGGRGMFDGVMTGSFSAPRIEGQFVGDDVRAWDVRWGSAVADLVIQGGYVDITHSRIGGPDGAVIVADGRYALGFRSDDAEEIRAQVQMTNWPIADLRHAFLLDDWPMDGTISDAELDLRGQVPDHVRVRAHAHRARTRVGRGLRCGDR